MSDFPRTNFGKTCSSDGDGNVKAGRKAKTSFFFETAPPIRATRAETARNANRTIDSRIDLSLACVSHLIEHFEVDFLQNSSRTGKFDRNCPGECLTNGALPAGRRRKVLLRIAVSLLISSKNATKNSEMVLRS